uniref:Secreted protein n=1 Tax=Onchocerca volvulus TaxID=6282 RepID=A0A8R1XZV2_ONCVO
MISSEFSAPFLTSTLSIILQLCGWMDIRHTCCCGAEATFRITNVCIISSKLKNGRNEFTNINATICQFGCLGTSTALLPFSKRKSTQEEGHLNIHKRWSVTINIQKLD